MTSDTNDIRRHGHVVRKTDRALPQQTNGRHTPIGGVCRPWIRSLGLAACSPSNDTRTK